MQDWKMTDKVARVEIDRLKNDGLEIDGQENDKRKKTDEQWRPDIDGPEFAGLENEGWKVTDRVTMAYKAGVNVNSGHTFICTLQPRIAPCGSF